MKTNQPKVQKKVAKKAAKKEMAKTLTERFLEAMTQLGQEAEKIGVDISKVGHAVVKKLSDKFAGDKALKKSAAVKGAKVGKKKVKELKKSAINAKPVTQSVKVVPIVSAEKVANAIEKKAAAKPVVVKKATAKDGAAPAPATKKTETKTPDAKKTVKPTRKKAASKDLAN
jgi:hypothetical protein